MSQASSVASIGARSSAPGFTSHRAGFAAVLGDRPRLAPVLACDAHEGPVYFPEEDALYFTTLPRRERGVPHVAIRRIQLDGERFPLEPDRLSVVVADANVANGMTRGPDGRLVVCEQGTLEEPARIALLDPASGARETLVDAFDGRPLNSPNDVVAASDGSIWFTDPSYGYLQRFRPRPVIGDCVYRFDGGLSVVAEGFDKPNGLAFSPDERVLYVGDSGANQEPGSYYPERPHDITAFDVGAGGLTGRRQFARTTPGFPDGIKVDSDGRVYASSSSGVQVFAPGGGLLGEIRLPGAVNFTFGGPGRNVLFITADDAVWAAVLEAKGA
ncbi:MAG TPA: SMP-30/gluconolactonase/LRE family protein [Thermoleophilaceae bacterium]|nr:SMP-30/gluconolactonase/LRE family protein [Thermoleophilaceae bacterium]